MSEVQQDPRYVEIVEDATNKVVKRMGPHPLRKAEKIADGASINLNHELYSVRVVKLKKTPKVAK